MATKFTEGDLACYWQPNEPERLVCVKRIKMMATNVNPTEYTVYCLENGKEYNVAGCWLQQVEISDVEMQTLGNLLPDTETPNLPQETVKHEEEAPPVASTSNERFATLNEEELDRLSEY